MKTFSKDELNSVIEKHQLWLDDEEGGERANLKDAYLRGANLENANLENAYLRGANLRGANLRDANLRDANLWDCSGNREEIKSIFISEIYAITYTFKDLQIGCKKYPINEWWRFGDEKILEMDGKALDFWREWKDTIKALIEKSPAKPTKHEQEEKGSETSSAA